MNLQQKTISQITLFFSFLIFLISLTKDAFCTTSGCIGSSTALFWGFFGLFIGGASLTWLANPILIISWIMILRNSRHKKLLLTGSIISTILSLSFLLFDKIITDEGGFEKDILNYKVGYWLWMASSLVLLIGNSTIYLLNTKNINRDSA